MFCSALPNSFSAQADQRLLGLAPAAGRGASALGKDLVQRVDPVAKFLNRHIAYIDQCLLEHSVNNILHGGFNGGGQMAKHLVMVGAYGDVDTGPAVWGWHRGSSGCLGVRTGRTA